MLSCALALLLAANAPQGPTERVVLPVKTLPVGSQWVFELAGHHCHPGRLAISDPSVADVRPRSRSAWIIGQQLGRARLLIWCADGRLLEQRLEIVPARGARGEEPQKPKGPELAALEQRLRQAAPRSTELYVVAAEGGGWALGGRVASHLDLPGLEALVEREHLSASAVEVSRTFLEQYAQQVNARLKKEGFSKVRVRLPEWGGDLVLEGAARDEAENARIRAMATPHRWARSKCTWTVVEGQEGRVTRLAPHSPGLGLGDTNGWGCLQGLVASADDLSRLEPLADEVCSPVELGPGVGAEQAARLEAALRSSSSPDRTGRSAGLPQLRASFAEDGLSLEGFVEPARRADAQAIFERFWTPERLPVAKQDAQLRAALARAAPRSPGLAFSARDPRTVIGRVGHLDDLPGLEEFFRAHSDLTAAVAFSAGAGEEHAQALTRRLAQAGFASLEVRWEQGRLVPTGSVRTLEERERAWALLEGTWSPGLELRLARKVVVAQSITGRVRNSSGAPVAGAMVRFVPEGKWRARHSGSEGDVLSSERTDAEGRFVLPVNDGPGRVEVEAARQGALSGTLKAPARVDLVVTEPKALAVRVLGDQGPVGKAEVHLLDLASIYCHSRGLTDARGVARMERFGPGPATAFVEVPGYLPLYQAIPWATSAVDLRPKRSARVFGTVVYRGAPVERVKVQLVESPASSDPIPPLVTRADGRFSFEKVRPGRYELRAESWTRKQAAAVEVKEGTQAEVDLELDAEE